MDIGMPGLNGIAATLQLTKDHPRTRVVALSMNGDHRYVHAMFEAGAWAYVVKSSASDELVRATRAVSRGEKYVSPARQQRPGGPASQSNAPRLQSKHSHALVVFEPQSRVGAAPSALRQRGVSLKD